MTRQSYQAVTATLAGQSQAEIAAAMGVTQPRVSQVLGDACRANPAIGWALDIARTFHRQHRQHRQTN